MSTSLSDRIEKQIDLQAPIARVWRALTDAREFGAWFRVELEGDFAVGESIRGQITFPGYEHLSFEAWVERMDRPRLFSFRWHPDEEASADASAGLTTLVEFSLQEIDGGTRLQVVESGFDQLPPERRERAFRVNDEGWTTQMGHIGAYVGGA